MAKIYLFILLSLPYTCFAQAERIDTDRPDQTESPNITPRHYFQSETGFNIETISPDDYDLVYPTVLFRYGLGKVELRLETDYRGAYRQLIPDGKFTNGFEPVSIGFKALVFEEKDATPKTSVIGSVSIPSLASKNYKADHLAPSLLIAMQNTLATHAALSYNIGIVWNGYDTTPSLLYSLSPGFDLGKKCTGFIEIYGLIHPHQKPENSMDTGLTFYLGNNTTIDISGGWRISNEALKNFIALGFSFRVK